MATTSIDRVEDNDEVGGLVFAPKWRTASVPVERLQLRSSLRRGPLRPEHVETLVAAAGNWPPILVHRSTLVVIDGRYRVQAARILRLPTVQVEWFDGSEAMALVEALRRNVTHGLPLTLSERKSAAVHLLAANREWSDGRIAELCGLSPKTIARLRPGSEGDGVRRLGRDGRYRPAQPGAVRQRVAELIAEDEGASLRVIAARAGVSHETVRSVRNELARTADPQRREPETIPACNRRGLRRGATTRRASRRKKARSSPPGSTPPGSSTRSTVWPSMRTRPTSP